MLKDFALAGALIAMFTIAACSQNQTAGESSLSHTGVCVHLSTPYSEWDCPEMLQGTVVQGAAEQSQTGTVTPVNVTDIEDAWLRVKLKTGVIVEYPLAKSTDAVFIGKRVTEDILANHYEAVKGDKKAADDIRAKVKSWP